VRVGAASVNASALRELRRAWQRRELVLFLGAGVSVPYGLPSWRNLVLELLFEQARNTRRLGPLLPHYRSAVASWMADYFQYDPLVLARMVERNLREAARRAGPAAAEEGFLERLREHLYANFTDPPKRTLLQALADLIERGTGADGVEAVVSFNFDDLLERELEKRRVKFATVAGAKRERAGGLRVIHPHGYVPQQGPLSRHDVVFTEPDYHLLTEAVFHWGLSEIVQRLRKSTVLFVGLSMSDPSLRRLLDASHNSEIPPHFQIQKRHGLQDSDTDAAMKEVERRARTYAAATGRGFDELKTPPQLEDAIGAALKQADTYDREVFESMGVNTIWVDDFAEIPDIVDAIPQRGRGRRRS
jgi:hypothetical protein